jgi:Ca2+-binding RTX toxin-like protein
VLPNGQYASNGFEALAALDTNGDGVINNSDSAYSQLRIWRDADMDGRVDAGELRTLSQASVQSIGLGYTSGTTVDVNGNHHLQTGQYTTSSGAIRAVHDVWFAQNPVDTVEAAPVPLTSEIAALPDLPGMGSVRSLHQAMMLDTTGTLQGLVESYVATTDRVARAGILQNLIYAWAGVSAVDPASRGEFIADARMLAALEVFGGRGFIQGSGTNAGLSSPGPSASAVLTNGFQTLATYFDSILLSQTHLKFVFDSVTLTWDAVGSRLAWDTAPTFTLLQQVYAQDAAEGGALIRDLAEMLRNLGPTGRTLIMQLQQRGDIEQPGFLSALAELDYEVTSGTALSESLAGEATDDALFGLGGNDHLNGNAGNDLLDGGAGADVLNGGAGSDIYLFGAGSGSDVVNNYDPDPTSTDIVRLKTGLRPEDITLHRNNDDLVLIAGTDQLTIEDFFDGETLGGRAIDAIEFDDGTSWGLAEINQKMIPDGTSGNDVLWAYPTGSEIFGLDGSDTLNGGAGADVLHGDNGADTLRGNAQRDQLFGGDGDDSLYGGAGADDLAGGRGSDYLAGGTGNDVYEFNVGDGSDVLLDTQGSNQLRLGAGILPASVTLLVGARAGALYGSAYAAVADDLVFQLGGADGIRQTAGLFNISALSEIAFADGTRITVTRTVEPGLSSLSLIDNPGFVGIGDDAANAITGNALSNVLIGGRGATRLSAVPATTRTLSTHPIAHFSGRAASGCTISSTSSSRRRTAATTRFAPTRCTARRCRST